MKIAVVDDEPIFCQIIADKLGDTYSITVFHDGKSFLQKADLFDLVLLDIDMPEMNGLEVAKQIRNKNIMILFLTSMSDQVFHAFGKNVFRFILKENIDTLPTILSDVIEEEKSSTSFVINACQRTWEVPFDHVLYIEYNNRRLYLHTMNNIFTVPNYTFDEIIKETDDRFLTIYRSICVNLDHVSLIQQHTVIMDNKEKLPISRKHVQTVKAAYIRRILHD